MSANHPTLEYTPKEEGGKLKSNRLVVFLLDEHRYALRLSVVERVLRVVEITPLPKAPDNVLGVVNVQGQVFPVLNLRKLFHLPEREITLNDQLIIAHNSNLNVALLTDSVNGVVECREQDVITPERIFPGIEYVEGVVKVEEDIIFINNLDRLLSHEDKALHDHLLGLRAQESGGKND